MAIDYAQEKLMQAIDTLATGTGTIQDRLGGAALYLIRLKPEDFPEGDLRKLFQGVKDDLTFEPAKGDEGTIAATLRITDDEDARAIAKRIVSLFHGIGRVINDR